MITKLDKKETWVQVNFRVPRSYKTALRTLAAASGLDIENLGADALGLFMGQKPLDQEIYNLAKKKMKEANIEKLCQEAPSFTRYGSDRDSGEREFEFGSAVSSVVEHVLHTDGVAGSKPAPRTINFKVVAIKPNKVVSVADAAGHNSSDATTLGSVHTPSALLDSKSSVPSSSGPGAAPVVPYARRSLQRHHHKAGSG